MDTAATYRPFLPDMKIIRIRTYVPFPKSNSQYFHQNESQIVKNRNANLW